MPRPSPSSRGHVKAGAFFEIITRNRCRIKIPATDTAATALEVATRAHATRRRALARLGTIREPSTGRISVADRKATTQSEVTAPRGQSAGHPLRALCSGQTNRAPHPVSQRRGRCPVQTTDDPGGPSDGIAHRRCDRLPSGNGNRARRPPSRGSRRPLRHDERGRWPVPCRKGGGATDLGDGRTRPRTRETPIPIVERPAGCGNRNRITQALNAENRDARVASCSPGISGLDGTGGSELKRPQRRESGLAHAEVLDAHTKSRNHAGVQEAPLMEPLRQ